VGVLLRGRQVEVTRQSLHGRSGGASPEELGQSYRAAPHHPPTAVPSPPR
jgi:hypothetical protein